MTPQERKKREERIRKICDTINKAEKKADTITYLGSGDVIPMARFPSGCSELDVALGGGWPIGRFIELFGPESGGKSTTCLHAIAEFQKAFPDKDVALIDTEYSFDEEYARAIGVDIEFLLVHQPESGEQALKVVRHLIHLGVGLIVVDSVAALTPEAELAGEIGDVHVGQQARLMSQSMRMLTAEAGSRGVTIFWTNQMREKIGVMYGEKTTTPGGRALRHYASIRVNISAISKEKDGEVIVGSKVQADVKKNKCIASGEVMFVPDEGRCYYVDELVGRPTFSVTSYGDSRLLTTQSRGCIPQSVEPCIEVGVRGIGSLVTNLDHPYLTKTGFIAAKDLRPRDFVAVASIIPIPKQKRANVTSWTESMARLAGLLAGDGWTGGTTGVSLRNFSETCVYAFQSCCADFGCEVYEKKDQKGLWVIRQKNGGHKGKPSQMNGFLKDCGLFGKTAKDKEVPPELFFCPRKTVGSFLGGLIATDGFVSQEGDGRWAVGFCTVSKKLAEGIRHLLLKEGIVSCVSSRKPEKGGIVDGRQILGKRIKYEVRVRRTEDVLSLRSIVRWSDGKMDIIPTIARKKNPKVILWKRVKFIKPAGDRMTYDICETGFENFEIHGMITHNTAAPFKRAVFYISFGTGIDRFAAVCDAAIARKVVTKRGAKICLDSIIIAAGRRDFLDVVKKDPELFNKLDGLVKAAPPPETEEVGDAEEDEATAKSTIKKPKTMGTPKRVPVTSDDALPPGDDAVETQDA